MATASASTAAAAISTAAAASTHTPTNGGVTGGPGRQGGSGQGGGGGSASAPTFMTHKDNNNNDKNDSRMHSSRYSNNGSSSSQQSDHSHPHANNAYPPPPLHDHRYNSLHHSQQQQQQQRQSFADSEARIQENQQQGLSLHKYHPHPRDSPYSHPHQQHPQQQQQQQQQHHSYNLHVTAYGDPPNRPDRGGEDNIDSNHVNESSGGSIPSHYEGSDREYLQERADRGEAPLPPPYSDSNEVVNSQGRGSSSVNGPNGVHTSNSNSNNKSISNNGSSSYNHGRVHSAPHSFPSSHSFSSSSSFHSMNNNNNSSNNDASLSSASVSHHPNALNRYPFSIPSISAKLDQPHHGDGSDALSSLWKKTTPIQEPYFQTRHTIASQHTLSTLGGILFSLDEVPTEFNQDMYIAMRNRIFELEAKSVNYSPFSHSRKRSFERNSLDDYPDRYAQGYDVDSGRYSKRPAHRYPDTYDPPDQGPPPPTSHRQPTSHPSWYTPEVYSSRPRYPPHHGRPPSDRESDHRHPEGGPHCDQDSGPESHLGSRPGSPGPNHNNSALLPMQSAYSPPPTSELTRQQPHSGQPPHPSRPHQSGLPPQDRYQQQQPPNGERPSSNMPHNGPYPPNSHPHPPPHHQPNHHPPAHPSQHPQHPHPHGLPRQPLSWPPQHQAPQGYQQQQQPHSNQSNGPTGTAHSQPMSAVTPEQRQSIHQQRHRAQQQAQSAHSRSYHLHKHMRLLDQQRAAQMTAQQQQQQHQHQQHQQQKQQQGQSFKPIQRQYQPHQQMYPSYNQPIAIKPHPGPTQAQLQQQQQQQLQKQQAQAQAQNPNIRPNPFQQQQQRLTPQQQMMQRYQQQRQLQQKQHQLRQLQYLRSRPAATYPTQKTATSTSSSSALTGGSPGSHSPTPPRVFGSQVDRPIKKLTRPLECSNCMALDSLAWRPKVELQIVTPDESNPSGEPVTAAVGGEGAQGAKILCPVCTQYLQTHGKPRPVPPFRTNFLKKIHTRFKRELQEVRFQGWQDAQVLEIEDRMVERQFQMVFNGLDESDASQIQSRSGSVASSPAPTATIASISTTTDPASTGSAADKGGAISTSTSSSAKEAMAESSKVPESIVIKVEDDDEGTVGSLTKSKHEGVEVRTFQSEASVGELFGHRWRTEPVVGYTLVHFGGSDRTRMVPMNPTVPFLTVKFDRTTESITFAFRVLVNGLCLLSSGGGPPALHMPEMADDDESEEEEEVVVVPDNDKEDEPPSPSSSFPSGPVQSKGDATPEAAATISTTTNNINNNTATSESSSASTSTTAREVDAARK